MGFSGISIWNLLIILAIVVLLFGTKRLKSLGSDLGGMLKGFKESMGDANKADADAKVTETEIKPTEVKSVAQDSATRAPDATTSAPSDSATEKNSSQPK